MIVYTLFIFLLSFSQGSFYVTSRFDEPFEDALLESINNDEDFGDDDDVVSQVLDAIKEEADIRHNRALLKIKDYELYDDENDNSRYKKALKLYKQITHRGHSRNKKKSIHHKFLQKKKRGDHTFPRHNKNKKRSNPKTDELHKKENIKKKETSESKKEVSKDNIYDNDAIAVIGNQEENDQNKEDKNIKKEDNVQVASIKEDDALEKEQDIINKEIFLDANSNVDSENKTQKVPPPVTTTSSRLNNEGLDRISFYAIIGGCVVAGIAGIVLATFCWYKLRVETKERDELPAPPLNRKSTKKRSGKKDTPEEDNKLAQSAEVFHYHHAKKQMQQMGEPRKSAEEYAAEQSSEEEDDEDTVYECPGLAPPGDMKVVNPLFSDDSHHSDKQSDSPSQGDESEDIRKYSSLTSN